MINLFDIYSIPVFLEPWITRFYAPFEIDLLTALDGNAMTVDEAYEKLGPELSDSFLERAWRNPSRRVSRGPGQSLSRIPDAGRSGLSF